VNNPKDFRRRIIHRIYRSFLSVCNIALFYKLSPTDLLRPSPVP